MRTCILETCFALLILQTQAWAQATSARKKTR